MTPLIVITGLLIAAIIILSVNLRNANHARISAEIKLTENQKKFEEQSLYYRQFINQQLVGIATTELDKGFIEVNDKFCEMIGYSRDEILGKKWYEIAHPDDRERSLAQVQEIIDGKSDGYKTYRRYIKKNGEILHCSITVGCVRNPDGTIKNFPAILVDIGDRIEIENALREKENRYREIINSTKTGVVAFEAVNDGEDFIITEFNHGAELTESVDAADVVGRLLTETFPGCHEFGFLDAMKRVYKTGIPEVHGPGNYHDDRHSGWRESYIFKLSSGELITVYEDVTEKIEHENRIKANLEFLTTLIDTIPHPICYKDTSGVFQGCNLAFEKYFGIPKSNIIGLTVFDVYPEPFAKINHDADEEIFRNPGVFVYEVTAEMPDGAITHNIIHKATYNDPEGNIAGLVGIMIDITERKNIEAETKKRKEELENALKVKDEFLSMVSHELRTPLVPIVGYSEALIDGVLGELSDEVKEALRAIYNRGQDLARLIEDLLTLSRMERKALIVRTETLNIGEHIEETLRDYEHIEFPKSVSLRWTGENFDIEADHTRFHQIIRNLIENSIKYSAEQVNIHIRSRIDTDFGVIEIEDDGIGIADEHLDKIYDKFFQAEPIDTRSHGGTGLGLAITKELVELMGGSISARSTEGKGSVFTVKFPLANSGNISDKHLHNSVS